MRMRQPCARRSSAFLTLTLLPTLTPTRTPTPTPTLTLTLTLTLARYHWMLSYYMRAEGLALSWIGTGRCLFSLDFEDVHYADVR